MRDNLLKKIARRCFFPTGSVRSVLFGPLRGTILRINDVTGLSSPLYSGTERAHQRVFKRLLRSGDTAIDIGANWGGHTLLLSRLVGQSGQVIAIEPFPPAFAELQWHIQANDRTNVITLPMAVSDYCGESFFIPGQTASSGSLPSTYSTLPNKEDAVMVKVRRLDTLVLEELDIKHLRLVKVDVEGNEGKVMLGAQQIIRCFRPYWVIDLHTPEQDVLVAQWLTNYGYQIKRLNGPPILRTDIGWPHPEGVWGSILAEPDLSLSKEDTQKCEL